MECVGQACAVHILKEGAANPAGPGRKGKRAALNHVRAAATWAGIRVCLEPTADLTPFRQTRFTEGKLIGAQYEYAGNTCTHTTAAPE